MSSHLIEYEPGAATYAEQNDVPLVAIVIDRRHCTGADKGLRKVCGPAPDEFVSRLQTLVDEFENRFDDNEQVNPT